MSERGVLTAPAQMWDAAVQRAEVIKQLAARETVGRDAADSAAAELGVSRRQVYVLVKRWRAGEGVVSDLLPGRSSGGRGGGRLPDEVEAIVRDVLQKRYLTRQRLTVAAIGREITRECRIRGLPVPSRGTVLRRIAQLAPVSSVAAREGRNAARTLQSAGGAPPEITTLLEQVQVDHTPVDVIVVDERHRLPIGRPYLTAAIDVCSRCVVGLVVTLDAPSAARSAPAPRPPARAALASDTSSSRYGRSTANRAIACPRCASVSPVSPASAAEGTPAPAVLVMVKSSTAATIGSSRQPGVR